MSMKVQWQCDKCGMVYDKTIEPPARLTCDECGNQEIVVFDESQYPERTGDPTNPQCKGCKIPLIICEGCRFSIPFVKEKA